jgi:flavodoxin
MKTLVVFYSLDGNTKFIAQTIAETVGADLLELKPVRQPASRGFSKYFWGGRQVMMKETPELLPFDKKPQDYDLLFIGTPVWAWRYTPALATFFSKVPLQGKKIALFCCSGGGAGKTLEKMKDKLAGNEIVSQMSFIEPKRDRPLNAANAQNWAKGLQTLAK